jgi:hypothetical protein
MALPEFNDRGDLPQGLHEATLAEVLERFGGGSEIRQHATTVLVRIHQLVVNTGKLQRFIVTRLDDAWNCRGDCMIANDDELKGTRARIAYFEDLLAQMRVTANPELFPGMASGYRAEIEKMQREVLEYLTCHVSQTSPARVA